MSDQQGEKKRPSSAGGMLAVGAGIGTAVGAAVGNVAVGLALGVAVGIGAGALLDMTRNKSD